MFRLTLYMAPYQYTERVLLPGGATLRPGGGAVCTDSLTGGRPVCTQSSRLFWGKHQPSGALILLQIFLKVNDDLCVFLSISTLFMIAPPSSA
jgi:hypothetical protein